MGDLQATKAKSTADMMSQDVVDQTGWSSIETWLAGEREKQKDRIAERNANVRPDISKSSAKKRAEMAEERSADLELDLKRLEKKLESAFEAVESKGKLCVEYATKHKEAQVKADEQEIAIQHLKEQLQRTISENRDERNLVSRETPAIITTIIAVTTTVAAFPFFSSTT